jgi:hypothetical protein
MESARLIAVLTRIVSDVAVAEIYRRMLWSPRSNTGRSWEFCRSASEKSAMEYLQILARSIERTVSG